MHKIKNNEEEGRPGGVLHVPRWDLIGIQCMLCFVQSCLSSWLTISMGATVYDGFEGLD